MTDTIKITEFVKRPGVGRQGRAIKVRANFFEVTSLPDSNIHHYDVTITPEVPPSLNRRIYFEFENLQTNVLGHVKPVFDGRKNIYAPKPLTFADGDAATFDITLPEDDGATLGKRPPRAFKIKIKKAAEINMEELHRF